MKKACPKKTPKPKNEYGEKLSKAPKADNLKKKKKKKGMK
jgi:hypothetical protein